MTAVQQAVAPDFAVSLKCPSQLHLRETGELKRSDLQCSMTLWRGNAGSAYACRVYLSAVDFSASIRE